MSGFIYGGSCLIWSGASVFFSSLLPSSSCVEGYMMGLAAFPSDLVLCPQYRLHSKYHRVRYVVADVSGLARKMCHTHTLDGCDDHEGREKKRSYLPLGCRRNCCWICKSHRASVCVCVCVHNHFPLLMMDQDELFGVCHFWLSFGWRFQLRPFEDGLSTGKK